MNEVEKMYENAGIKKKPYCELNCSITKNDFECTSYCLHYEDEGLYYPPFTAEKQLELIKWLAKFDDFYVLKDFEFDKYRALCGLVASEYIDTFEEMLANLILNIWDELTKAQKAQIKEILE